MEAEERFDNLKIEGAAIHFPFQAVKIICSLRSTARRYTPSSARVSPAGVPLALPTFQRAIFALLPRCPHSVWGNENFVDGILLENQTFLNAAKFAEHVSLTFLKDISSFSKPQICARKRCFIARCKEHHFANLSALFEVQKHKITCCGRSSNAVVRLSCAVNGPSRPHHAFQPVFQ